MTKAEWEELKFRVKKVGDNPQFKKSIDKISGRNSKLKGNLHFGTKKNYSKANLKKGFSGWLQHNERENEKDLNYLLPENEREPNEYTQLSDNIIQTLKDKNLEPTQENYLKDYEKIIKDDYFNHHKRKMPKNSQPFIEAVLNLEKHHTIKDIKEAFKKADFPFQAVHIAIHRDEGHKNELTGQTLKNYHAHIILRNYDFKTHRTILRSFSKLEFKEMQRKVIKNLGMEINKDKKERKHLSRYQLQYRKEKQAEKLLKDLREYEKKQELNNHFKDRLKDFVKQDKQDRNVIQKGGYKR
ncbi:hypothetical protein NI012_001284 [Campylobacter jejuni]|uniref:Uncharacterized protein n=1 Tax=Campylobacter coli TaxID=195 RepID=A0A5T0VTY3_CAMCO|nr:hypothetical protein [Campylobacter jejuni]EAK4720722.1 hypothetical protein [Campylobacter coli]EAH5876259.1 hypothetical protein [Campylobacter jejuni]EAH9004559.1 hypothetical protein [Campylobacter jejuni]EAI3186635.1 hypothetical protein [Campylobacter jejuni]